MDEEVDKKYNTRKKSKVARRSSLTAITLIPHRDSDTN